MSKEEPPKKEYPGIDFCCGAYCTEAGCCPFDEPSTPEPTDTTNEVMVPECQSL